jgi:replicative DNA helicase
VLVHLGAQALREGKNVIHYTLELQDTVVANRYDSCLTGLPLSEIKSFKEEILEEVKKIQGSLIIKEYPTKSASTNTIKSHLEKLRKRGIKPGMIIVDYGDLLRPTVIRKEKRNELESIYEEMRALSNEFNCPVWTASQTNRSGLNAEVVTMESISEAFSKCFVADLIFSVSRTIEDKQANTGRIFVAKNRNGPDGMVYPIFMDTSNVGIKFAPPQPNPVTTPLNPVSLTSAMQSNLLKQKYSKLRKSGSMNK